MLNKIRKTYVVDTSVLAEYLDESSPFADKIETLFRKAYQGEVALYTVAPVTAELLYVASRFYTAMNIHQPNERARDYIAWLRHYVSLRIGSIDGELSLEAGELKKQLRIALTDCIVIAYALKVNATPLFRSVEKEMKNVEENMRRTGVSFLGDLEL